jgi:hypothetical protein
MQGLSDQIDWDFTVGRGMQAARYGQLKGIYFKQVLVGGAPAPEIHPPTQIHKQVYDLASRADQIYNIVKVDHKRG